MIGSLQGYVDGELIARVEEACAARGLTAGWVRGLGSVKNARLGRNGDVFAVYDEATLVSLDASVATLVGRATVRATAVLSVDCGGVPMTVSGELVSATCKQVELAFFGFDGIAATRQAGPGGSMTLEVEEVEGAAPAVAAAPRAAAPAPAPAPRSAPAPSRTASSTPSRTASSTPSRTERTPRPELEQSRSDRRDRLEPLAANRGTASRQRAAGASGGGKAADWSTVAAVSAAVSAGTDLENEIDVDELLRGDVLQHPALSACTVVKVVSDDAIKVQLADGSVRKLMMRPFRILRDGEGRNFKIEKRK